VDALFGGAGFDWFWAGATDALSGVQPAEPVN
jgi:hypothetical protein